MKNTERTTYFAFERILYINKCMLENLYPNTKSLSEKLEVSSSTIARDLDFMRCRLRAPIFFDASKRGYYYSEDYNILKDF